MKPFRNWRQKKGKKKKMFINHMCMCVERKIPARADIRLVASFSLRRNVRLFLFLSHSLFKDKNVDYKRS